MKCTWTLSLNKDGNTITHTFDDELALDDWLYGKYEYLKEDLEKARKGLPNQSDIVFSMSVNATEKYDIIKNNIKEFRQMLKDKKARYIKDSLHNDIESTDFEKPFMGTNRFLESIKTEDSSGTQHPLFPIFMEENYWRQKKSDWFAGKWASVEELNEVCSILGVQTIDKLETNEQFKILRDAYTNKWEAQAKHGNTIHEVMQVFFSRTEGKLNAFMSKEDLTQKIQQHFDDLKAELGEEQFNATYGKLSTKHLEQMLDYAKRFKRDLEKRFGSNLTYMPEVALQTQLGYSNADGSDRLMGVLDLLIIDNQGNVHIIDYKTSPKPYKDYNSVKKETFYYQLATYRRLLERAGLNLSYESGLYVAPIQLEGFTQNGNEWDYNNIVANHTAVNVTENGVTRVVNQENFLEDLTSTILASESISYNLDRLIPVPTTEAVKPKETLSYVQHWMDTWFPRFYSGQEVTDEEAMSYIQTHIKEKNKDGKYVYKRTFPNIVTFERDTQEELIKFVKEDLAGKKRYRGKLTESLKRNFTVAMKNGQKHLDIKGGVINKGKDPDWLAHTLEKYLNGNWEMMGGDQEDGWAALENLGMIGFKNKITKAIEIVKVTNRDTHQPCYLNGRTQLVGKYQPDIIEDNKSDSLMLEAVYGNIEYMEAMLALNANPDLFDNGNAALAQVLVVNLTSGNQRGLPATNKELVYCFNKLAELSGMQDNNFSDKNKSKTPVIKVRSTYDLVRDHLNEICVSGIDTKWQNLSPKWAKYDGCVSDLTTAMSDPVQARAALQRLSDKLEFGEDSFSGMHKTQTDPYSAEQSPQFKLQAEVVQAIAEIDGYDQRQQIKHDDSYWHDIKQLRHGHSGLMLDNQGFLSNKALNRLAKGTTIAYQNIREEVQGVKSKLKQLVEAVKKEEGFNYLLERTVGNQSSLFLSLTEKVKSENGSEDLYFVEPSTLHGAKRELLEYVLEVINCDRFEIDKTKSREEIKRSLDEAKSLDYSTYMSVPLALASTSSKMANIGGLQGLFAGVKDVLSSWNPFGKNVGGRNAASEFKKKVEGFLDITPDDTEEYARIRDNEQWHMINNFDKSLDPNYRYMMIKEEGIDSFERNLETLTLEHVFAYSRKKNLDEILPMVRATMINVANQGFIQNDKFTETLDYIGKYVRSKIFNQSLIDDNNKALKVFIGKMQSQASKFALAFSPAQLYQHLDGIWKDISLVWRKPDGETSFTKKNMLDAYFFAYKDLVHYGNGNSLSELLNEYYGINDMDMNAYVDKIKSDQSGIYNFNSLMFRMASRPDFYNRMTIFGAQMRGDGCWDAHYVENGKLKYNMAADKRFDVFAKYKTLDKVPKELVDKFNEQKAMYIAMATQMEREHTRNEDGTLFRLNLSDPKPLPKAYTTEQSEGMKALGDLMYGYYAHEKKSLWQSTAIGGLVMQMNTYWSSKKNQYLAPGGIKYMGRMEQYSEIQYDENNNPILDENGKPKIEYYWQVVDENGKVERIIKESEKTDDMIAIPLMQWKGQFQEGIFVTLLNQFATFWKPEENFKGGVTDRFKAVHERYWNHPDENLRRAYRSNIRQLWYDFLAFLLLGLWFGPALTKAAKEYMKENGNDTLAQSMWNTTYALGAALVSSSGRDFFAPQAILGIGMSWTPFAIQSWKRIAQNVFNILEGDKSFYDAIISSAAATRATRPVWDYLGDKTGWNIARNDEEE